MFMLLKEALPWLKPETICIMCVCNRKYVVDSKQNFHCASGVSRVLKLISFDGHIFSRVKNT